MGVAEGTHVISVPLGGAALDEVVVALEEGGPVQALHRGVPVVVDIAHRVKQRVSVDGLFGTEALQGIPHCGVGQESPEMLGPHQSIYDALESGRSKTGWAWSLP